MTTVVNNVTHKKGITFMRALGLLFIGLKLGGAISWSWPLVLLPLYGPLVVVYVLPIALAVICGVVLGIVKHVQK